MPIKSKSSIIEYEKEKFDIAEKFCRELSKMKKYDILIKLLGDFDNLDPESEISEIIEMENMKEPGHYTLLLGYVPPLPERFYDIYGDIWKTTNTLLDDIFDGKYSHVYEPF